MTIETQYQLLRSCYSKVVETIYKHRVDLLEEFPKSVIISKELPKINTKEVGLEQQLYAYRLITLKFTILLFLKANSIQKADLRKIVGLLLDSRPDNVSRQLYTVMTFDPTKVYKVTVSKERHRKINDLKEIEIILQGELEITSRHIEKVTNYYLDKKMPLWTTYI